MISRAKFWAVLATTFIASALMPAARADQLPLNVDYCACIPTSLGGVAGMITVTSPGINKVEIGVSLDSPLQFHQTNGLDGFNFNVVGFGSLTSSDITINNGGGSTWTLLPGPNHEGGAGTFMYSLTCTPGPNGCLTAPVESLDFTITATGLTMAAVESTNGGASHVDFGANVANANISGCTGIVGAGNGGEGTSPSGTTSSACAGTLPPSAVPEPSSIFLVGTTLMGLGCLLRKKLATAK